MKKIIFLFIFLGALHLYSQKNVAPLNTYTFEEAIELQAKEERPLVVFIHTDWCKFCFGMKKNTFRNKDIINILNNEFYFVSLNAEQKEPIEVQGHKFEYKSGVHELAQTLGSKNGTISYPSTVILNSKNIIDEQISTFLSKSQLKNILTEYLKLNKNI